MKFAVFKVGEEDFGIGIEQIVEILSAQRVHSLPELPEFLSGVITVRGEVIPLLDLRKRFGVKSPETREFIIVVQYDNEKLGLLVDEIREIVALNAEDISSPPSIFKGLRKKYLTGLGKKDDKIIILLDVDYLLSSEEKIMLKDSEGILKEDAEPGKTAERQ
jgi:purine-binding chemotaxis protein CheW